MELCDMSAHALSSALERREVSAEEVMQSVLERIAAKEDSLQCFISTYDKNDVLSVSRGIDGRRANGEKLSPLAGIPIAVKDNICTDGVATTCGSKILQGYVPPYDATVVDRLKEAGLVVVGKTNMDEFAMGSSTENSGFYPTRNPWDTSRVPGGSSGGSAAAVASGEAILSLGSDTGGSIRQPASFCGVVGMKPTYGRVSRFGLVAYASSLDQIGPFGRDVRDVAMLLQTIAGPDALDSTCVKEDVPDYLAALEDGVKGMVIGLPEEYFAAGIDPAVKQAVMDAVKVLEGLGAKVTAVSMPHTEHALSAYYLIAPSEASSNLARYDGVRYGHRTAEANDTVSMFSRTREEGFGPEVKRRIMLGTYALSAGYYDAYYLKALKVRTLVKQDFDKAFESCDILATPTAPSVAFKLGEKVDDPLQMYLSDVCTIPINLAGLPAVSLPCGKHQGMPVGLQLIGRALHEKQLLQAAYAYEQAAGTEVR